MDQRDRFNKENYKLHRELEDVKKSNEYLRGTLKNYEDRFEELERENKDLKQSIGNQKTTITYLQNMNLDRATKITELEKKNYLQKGIITDYQDQKKQWEYVNSEYDNLKYTVNQQAQTINAKQLQIDELRKNKEDLEKSTAFWMQLCHKLQGEIGDLKWLSDNPDMVEKQTARTCLNIVTKIKNEPLTKVSTHREWMVAICEDIEKEIKKEFDLK
jgi:chromosome segregation ATPase